MLWNPEKHTELTNDNWCEEAVHKCIHSIFDDTLESFDEVKYWPTDANEDASIDSNKTIYYGAAGNIWALDVISNFTKKDLPFDKKELINQIHKDYLKEPDTKDIVPSLFLGEVGILLVQYKLDPTKEVSDKIYSSVEGNIENATLEALWGAPGTMIAAAFMHELTSESRWEELYKRNVVFLLDKLKEEEAKGELVWEQDMYGKKIRYIGAGHGYFGNIFGLLKKIDFLSSEEKEYIFSHVEKVLKEVSNENNGMMNFDVIHSKEPNDMKITQWCHGAPGIVNSLKNFPQGSYVDECLEKSGELIFNAGPLKKGVALCHGTDGNGIALLQLYKRTNDLKWLNRARSFGMHAIGQRNGRKTLFTGELGLALYLIMCLEGIDDFPFLDSLY